MNRNEKLTKMAMLVALAMIFSYVESLIPINFGIPGMKLGVANLVTVTGLYFLELPEVFLVVVMRILLTGFLFGTMHMLSSFGNTNILLFLCQWLDYFLSGLFLGFIYKKYKNIWINIWKSIHNLEEIKQ